LNLICNCSTKYFLYTLKNKGASRCHRKTFLSKWFHKETLTSEESFCFTKLYLWWKKVLQIIKKVRKEILTEWFFVEQKLFLYGITWSTFWSTFIFKSVVWIWVIWAKFRYTMSINAVNITWLTNISYDASLLFINPFPWPCGMHISESEVVEHPSTFHLPLNSAILYNSFGMLFFAYYIMGKFSISDTVNFWRATASTLIKSIWSSPSDILENYRYVWWIRLHFLLNL